jgi:glycosyltransferase involved in cell wall biosynthesis
MEMHEGNLELTILMPCLNEAETIGVCVRKAKSFLLEKDIKGEILIADNGSTDGSPEIAEGLGVRVIHVEQRGYGSALLGGIDASRGKFIIMGDADDSYDFSRLDDFIEKLREGYDLVMGNRFAGGIEPGAMPILHQYLGNPVLSFIGRLFFQSPVGDFHCGLRGFNKESVMKLNLQTKGMEFASEMIVKASLFGYRITEVPTTLSPAGRSRAPHLRTWQDGWRHLRFLLLYSPRWLFLFPGISLAVVGTAISMVLLPGPVTISGTRFDIHTLLYSSMAVVLGFQLILFAMFTKIFAISEGLLPEDPRLDRIYKYIRLETGLLGGSILFGLGAALSILAYLRWSQEGFGDLVPGRTFRIVIPAVLLIILGVQTVFSSFFLSVLGLKRHN